MGEDKRFDDEQLRGAKFHETRPDAEFESVDLAESKFTNVNLQGAKLNDVNLSNVIDDANISGLTIFGWNITVLIKEAQQRKASRILPPDHVSGFGGQRRAKSDQRSQQTTAKKLRTE